ncbi:hypothetical protein BO1005MUT1_530078 [Hyphomicrobiales bacterium]|nr:hypothetical protein BO1005MUT1_530078 [Hyphomicrobiales bacterium]
MTKSRTASLSLKNAANAAAAVLWGFSVIDPLSFQAQWRSRTQLTKPPSSTEAFERSF